jgi:outer membrane protein OmpA-like peptidoglycan-associated protein
MIATAVAGSIAMMMPGCEAYQRQSGTTKGAVIGTAGGAAVGSAIGAIAGGGEGAWKGAAIGAVVGGVGGGLLGRYMDKQAAEMQSVLSDQDRLRREQETLYLTLGSDVLFDSGSATLQPGARDKLAEVAGILRRYPRTVIQITGHTDSRGAEEMNRDLSLRRAGAVADQLIADGVSSARIATRGEGEARPVANNETLEGRQLNRRVDLVIRPDDEFRTEAAQQTGEEPK